MQPTAVRNRGYARPELLAESDWLADHLTDPSVRLVDARPSKQYEVEHIPGAVNLSGFGGVPKADSGEMASPDEFASVAGNLGVSNDTTVVVYDAPSQMMGMVAWAFMYYGHADVRLLDGGLAKWTREDRPVTTEIVTYPTATFVPIEQAPLVCTLDQAKSAVNQPKSVFWDTRSRAEYEGTQAGFGAPVRMGRIPGAVHLEWSELFDDETKTFKTQDDLITLLASRGITPESEINTY